MSGSWLHLAEFEGSRGGPSTTPRGLRLLVKESEVQPGLLALQMLGHVGGDGIVPEAAGHTDRHSALGAACLSSSLRPLSYRWMG